jgi:serpin B
MLKTPVPLLISSVLHDAVFSFDENGVEAAAVTAMGASGTSSGQEPDLEEKTFFADRPFVYLVREKSSGVILFAGVFCGD